MHVADRVNSLFSRYRYKLRKSLQAKLLLQILPILFLIIVPLALLLSTIVSQYVYELYKTELMRQSETLELSLEHGFITNDLAMVRKMVQSVGQVGQVISIRFLNKEGLVLASSAPAEIDVHLDRDSGSCRLCHSISEGDYRNAIRTRSVDDEQDVVIIANRIENRVACQKCHDGSISTLGVLLMENSAMPVDFTLEYLDWNIVAGGVLVLMLVVVSWLIVINHLVIVPLRILSNRTDLERERQDEIGVIASRISELEGSLAQTQSESSKRLEDLNALLSISESTVGTLSVGQLLQQVLDTVLQVTDFSAGGIRLLDRERECLQLISHRGMTPKMIRELECIPQDVGFHGEAARTLCPVSTTNLATDPWTRSHSAVEEGYRSLVCVPLLAGDELIGIMEVASKEERALDKNDLRWFATIGSQIGIPVNRIQLSEQTRDSAILEERGRLSQEIHDGLSQLIGTLRVRAEDALLSLDAKDWENARQTIQEIEQTATDAYASLREEMLGLRDTIVSGQDLVPLFTEFLSRFQRQWGIEAKLLMEDKQPYSAAPNVEIQLLRIVQEAITNVRRHASATLVLVRLKQDDNWLRISVEDDGQGFDISKDRGENQLGLRIMNERASAVGGKLSVLTSPGGGTSVQIVVPKRPKQNLYYKDIADENSSTRG